MSGWAASSRIASGRNNRAPSLLSWLPAKELSRFFSLALSPRWLYGVGQAGMQAPRPTATTATRGSRKAKEKSDAVVETKGKGGTGDRTGGSKGETSAHRGPEPRARPASPDDCWRRAKQPHGGPESRQAPRDHVSGERRPRLNGRRVSRRVQLGRLDEARLALGLRTSTGRRGVPGRRAKTLAWVGGQHLA